jgi:PAS domain-containing protein
VRGRWTVHLPWLIIVFGAMLIVGIEWVVLHPMEVEGHRQAATQSIHAAAVKDLRLVRSQRAAHGESELQKLVAASSEVPGLAFMEVSAPNGEILASFGNDAGEETDIPSVEPGLRVTRAPYSDDVHVIAPLGISAADPGGLYRQRWDLEPFLDDASESSRMFLVGTVLLTILVAASAQVLLYIFLTRRLHRLGKDIKRFGDGARQGLFEERLDDDIGQIVGLLSEAAQGVFENEETAERLALAVESANAGIWDWNMSDDLVQTSAEYHTMLGDRPVAGGIGARDLISRIHPEEKSHVRNVIEWLHTPDNDSYDEEFRMRSLTKDRYTWIRGTHGGATR